MKIDSLPMGVYVPGKTLLHRMSPKKKFVLLILYILIATNFGRTFPIALTLLGLVFVLYIVARIPIRIVANQLVPILPLLAILGAFLVWQNGIWLAGVTLITLFATILAANLLTLTTTVEALLVSLEEGLKPLGRFGIPTEKISLAIALTLRLIPLILQTSQEVLDARKARGLGFSPLAFGVPLIVRSIRRAEQIGDALVARGALD